VHLNFNECRGRTFFSLSSCPSDGVTPPQSCVELSVAVSDAQGSGEGAYYDAAGALFDVVITDAELSLDDLSQESIRAGVMRGSRSRNGGDGASQPFELTFSACSHPRSGCLL
jgi:hypothetical protein